MNQTGAPGMVYPKVGEPNTLVIQYLPANTPVSVGNYVVTSALSPAKGPCCSRAESRSGRSARSAKKRPTRRLKSLLANLRGLETVQVLTAVPGSGPAQANSVAASLPPEQSSETAGGTGGGQLASTGSGG